MATNPNLAAIQAAAAIAAKINASIGAGGGPVGAAPAPPVPTVFEATVDINFARSRANLVKGATQSQIARDSGASIVTKGRYKPVGDMSAEDPLHLVIKADTQEQLDDCIRKINALMGQQHIKAFRCSSKCVLGMDSPPGFDLETELKGPNNQFFDHIQGETRAYLAVRGRGAPPPFNTEMNEPLQVYIGGDTEAVVTAALSLVENLLVAVRRKIQAFIASMPPAIPTFPAAYGYQHENNAQAYNIQSMAMQAIQAAHGMSGHNQPQQPHYPPQMMPAPRPPAPAPVPSNGRYNAVAPPSFVQATAEEVMRETGGAGGGGGGGGGGDGSVPLWEQAARHAPSQGSAPLPFQPGGGGGGRDGGYRGRGSYDEESRRRERGSHDEEPRRRERRRFREAGEEGDGGGGDREPQRRRFSEGPALSPGSGHQQLASGAAPAYHAAPGGQMHPPPHPAQMGPPGNVQQQQQQQQQQPQGSTALAGMLAGYGEDDE